MITAVAVGSCSGACVLASAPTNTVTYPVAIKQDNVAVKWFNAAAGTGTTGALGGSWPITATLRLGIPAKTRAGSYTATETYSITQGP